MKQFSVRRVALLGTLLLAARFTSLADDLAFLSWAKSPPMGWNSYDAFGSSVTEAEFLANASYVKEKLLPSGYNTVVVDFRWADTTAANYDANGIGGPLVADEFGRLLPSPVRFPSAADGRGFKPLADKVHAMGLKFGIHVMRGIPKQSVKANTRIEGSKFKAVDAADTNSICKWCRDMWGINATKQAGQDYYDSIFRLYASWGVDFVKVDDLSQPYHQEEMEAVRRAIDKCGRPMVFSTSPGQTPVEQASHIAAHANMWRISGDFWDKWSSLDHAFDLAAKWQGVAGPGHWPDADMLPLGRIGIRCVGKDRLTRFTKDEQVAMMSLWALMPSPLMLGGHQPDNDAWTLSLITNPDMLAINQDPLGKPGRRALKKDRTEVWVRDLKDGGRAVGIFNRGDTNATVTLNVAEAGLVENGPYRIKNVWTGEAMDAPGAELVIPVSKHGAVLLKLARP
jgi:alpha-galactosidase